MTEPCLIQLVDDDEPIRLSFSFALTALGFRVMTYVDADDFLMRGERERGVLLSDVRMPGMNGIDLTRLLRRDGSDIPIILMTGHSDAELHADALSAGADNLLAKPLALADLIAEIERLTKRWE